MKKVAFIATFLWVCISGQAYAQTPKCDALTAENKSIAQSALQEIKSYGCCTDSVASCLAKKDDACKLPGLLADDICSQISKGKKLADIKEALTQRTKTMSPDAKIHSIDIKPEHLWGNPDAKVVLSVYLCGRCPYCSRHVPQLIHTLENSPLKDKIAVNLKYFPIKAHDNSTPAALAIEAAARMGKAWPYLIKSYENFDAFTLNKIMDWGKELGLDIEQMKTFMKDPEVRKSVADSKKEGLINGVTTTPTLFLNGRRIEGNFDVDTIMSMLEEALLNEH
ncbi:MAG: thioredoxin domain-containing protein [Proteobacteria bacterium]|nr:thioredoxin domain-containing protein [Pseudomonadota bacterium]